jgi:hypothetical protein
MPEFRNHLFGLGLLVCSLAASAPALAQSIRNNGGSSTGTTTTTTGTTTTGSTTPGTTMTGTTTTGTTTTGATTTPTGGQPVFTQPSMGPGGQGGGSHTASLSQQGDGCASGPPNLPIWNAGDVADNVKAMSKATSYYLENCHCPDATCVADALDNYAAALEAIGPRLPPAVADLPAIVRRAARKVRAARSISQARAAIGEAEHTIQAKLQLLEVTDPDTRSDSFRSARFTGDLLSVANVSLVRVAGL